jgi:hypothetical protein
MAVPRLACAFAAALATGRAFGSGRSAPGNVIDAPTGEPKLAAAGR